MNPYKFHSTVHVLVRQALKEILNTDSDKIYSHIESIDNTNNVIKLKDGRRFKLVPKMLMRE